MVPDSPPEFPGRSGPAPNHPGAAAAADTLHDLRGALAVVVGRTQLLSRHLRTTDDPSPERLLAGLAEIERAAKRIAASLDALDDVAPAPGRGRSGQAPRVDRAPDRGRPDSLGRR